MEKFDIRELTQNVVRMIGDNWMLITAGTPEKFNTMTASWGGLGFLWNKPVAYVFIRPQRYTFEFTEANEMLTLSFLDTPYRSAMTLLGSNSGRDMDKVAQSKLVPTQTENGNMTFQEARIVLECRKLYADAIDPKSFLDPELAKEWYPEKDFHRMYVVEIVNAYKQDGCDL